MSLVPAALPDERAHRFVALLRKDVPIGNLLNALGHMAAGLAGTSNPAAMQFLTYRDQDGNEHAGVSHYGFIVLQANSKDDIRTFRAALKEAGLPFTDFTKSMTIGTSEEQMASTACMPEAELDYYGICTFGSTEVLKPLTKKFSLFKGHSSFAI